jgi:peptidoglycan/xylan/chitin deacetylase (PgdA/CDA1 family)
MAGNEQDYLARLKGIFSPYGIDLYRKSEELALTWDQLRAMSCFPKVTIGAHSVNHLQLNRISPDALKFEISFSRSRLESILGKKIDHFSYPFGNFLHVGEREREMVKRVQFKTAVSNQIGNVFQDHSEAMDFLPRFDISYAQNDLRRMRILTSGALAAVTNRLRRMPVC